MKLIATLLFLAASIPFALAADEGQWSEKSHGLRGRLSVKPAVKDDPFCLIYVELQNVDEVMGEKKIRFLPGKIAFKVTDEAGKELPESNGPYDGMSPIWTPLFIPMDGTMKFRISFPGLGYDPAKDKVIVDLGRAWVIPQDGKSYYLSGDFTIKPEADEHSVMDWRGTLQFPRVKIPGPKAEK